MRRSRYDLLPIESGVFAELYLPKKAHFQGVLYDTLTAGFDIKAVRKYLRDHRTQIKAYLQRSAQYWEISAIHPHYDSDLLSPAFITHFPELLDGYTSYEVDGVFRSANSGRIEEDHTQVIRMMFRPDFEVQFKDLPFIGKDNRDSAETVARAYIRSHHWSEQSFVEDYTAFHSGRPFSRPELERIVDATARWTRAIGIFLFGYVAHRICEGIRTLHKGGHVDMEEEIWITFFWNLVIGRIKERSSRSGD